LYSLYAWFAFERKSWWKFFRGDFSPQFEILQTREVCGSSAIFSQLRNRLLQHLDIITFCVSRRRRKMYCGHPLCLSVCLSAAACLHYCTDPDVTWRSGRGCPLVVHCWADLQSVHGLRCYGNTIEHYGNAWQSPAVIRQAHHTPHALGMRAACGEDSPHWR